MHTIFRKGDTVRFSREFLRATGQIVGEVAHAKGRIIGLRAISNGIDLALIEWDRKGIMSNALTSNLVLEKRIHLEAY